MYNLALLRLRHSDESLEYVKERMSAENQLAVGLTDVTERMALQKEFTDFYDKKWLELKQRHREEISHYLGSES